MVGHDEHWATPRKRSVVTNAEDRREEAPHDETGDPGTHAVSVSHPPKTCGSARLPRQCLLRHGLGPERRERKADERGEHRDGHDPAKSGEDWSDGVLPHDLSVASGKHD